MSAEKPKKKSKGERTAQRIMDVAEKLFATRGYGATTLRDIAEGANIREPGLYNHFVGKEALYRAVLERALKPVADVIDAQLGDAEKAHDLSAAVIDLLAAHPHVAALFQHALLNGGEDSGSELMMEWLERLMDKGIQVLTRHTVDASAREDAALYVIALFNLNAGYFTAAPLLQRLCGGDALDASALAKQKRLARRLIGALAARPAPKGA